MTAVVYNKRSPYYNTTQKDKYVQYLDFWSNITIPASSNDELITLDTKYSNRPDLLAFDMYGSAQLWWAFAVRNPDIIKDPIFDFKPGISIYIPSKDAMGSWVK